MDFTKEIAFCLKAIGKAHIEPCEVLRLSVDKKVLRNISLLAALTNDKPLFDKTLQFQSCLIMTYEVDEDPGVPEMKEFEYSGFQLPPSNFFVQMLHNVVSYMGNSSWLTKFLCDEASQVEGTKYLCSGTGPVDQIDVNLRRWGFKMNVNHLLVQACEGKADIEVCTFLVSKGAKITPHIEKCLAKNPDLLECLTDLVKSRKPSRKSGI